MGEMFHDKIRFKLVIFEKAQELAAYNFKFKSSVEYLDLATNENLLRDIQPSSFKAVLTFEDIQKRMVPERQTLYKIHLDLPKDLKSFSCRKRTEIVTGEAFHIKRVDLLSSVIYNNGLERHIVAAIENDKRKIERLRSYMKIFEILKFDRDDRSGLFLCDSILRMLCRENCRDSDLLRNFLRLVSLPQWLCDGNNPEVLKYLLLQAIRGRFLKDLWRDDPQADIVGLCLINHKIQNMKLLIEYGTVAINPSESNLYTPGTAGLRDEDPVIYPRVCRTLQLFYYFLFHWHAPEGLRFMWQTIKEPFLSRAEIDSCLKPMFPPDPIETAIRYYEVWIIEQEVCSSGLTPRRLKDLCRVDIRKLLSDNYQIPFGISPLDIPESLKTFLNLEECLPSRQVDRDV